MKVQYGKMQKIGKNTQTENQIKQIRQQIKRCLEENKTETPTKVPTHTVGPDSCELDISI